MKQKFELNKNVYVFRSNAKGEVETSQGKIVSAEINAAGYIQYGVLTQGEKPEVWQGTCASIAFSEDEVKELVEKFNKLALENRTRYEESFGKPEFSEQELKDGE